MAVDDEPDILTVVGYYLQDHGFQVTPASSVDQALQKIKEGYRPDLVLLDILMPLKDGFVLLEELRRHHPTLNGLPIIMLTAVSDTQHILQAQQSRATDYLVKPFSETELVEIVKKYI